VVGLVAGGLLVAVHAGFLKVRGKPVLPA
jgi:hypothetical protein